MKIIVPQAVPRLKHLARCAVLLAAIALPGPATWAHAQEQTTLVFSSFNDSCQSVITESILRKAYSRLGIRIVTSLGTGKRALMDSTRGATDGELQRIPEFQAEHPSLIRIEPPLMHLVGLPFARDRAIRVDGVDSLRPLRIGVLQGVAYAESLVVNKGFNVTVALDTDKLVTLLAKDRIDVFIGDMRNVFRILRERGIEGIAPAGPPLAMKPLHHYLHHKHAALIPAISAELERMENSGDIAAIIGEHDKTCGLPQAR